MAETLQEFASAAVHSEHLWLGVIYTNMIHHFQKHDLDFDITTRKPCARSNLFWKQLDGNNLYSRSSNLFWQLPKRCGRSRRIPDVKLGVPTAAERVSLARQKKQQGDIRKWFKRVKHKVESLQHLTEGQRDTDRYDAADLLVETPTTTLHTAR